MNPNETILLADIAHGRSGDKGNHANIGIIAWTDEGYALLQQVLTADLVGDCFAAQNPSHVERFALPGIRGFNFLLHNVLAGGASRSLRIDSQGKTFASALLQMPLAVPENLEQMKKPQPD